MRLLSSFFTAFILFTHVAFAQTTFPVNGTHNNSDVYYVFKNATIHLDYASVLEGGIMIVQDGKIIAVGDALEVPDGAIVYDLEGKHVYPSIIDPYTDYGMPKIPKAKRERQEQFLSDKKGAFGWNQAIKPEIDAAEIYTYDPKTAEKLRNAGIGAVLTHQMDGIARGTSVAVLLGENDNKSMLTSYAASHLSFKKGSSTQDYPGSQMGAIALLRQTYYDADWYATTKEKKEHNLSLEAFNNNLTLPTIFEVSDYQEIIRADKIGDEFGIQYIIKGTGDEYKRINEVVVTDAALIIPVDFPKVYDVEDPYDAMLVALEDLKHWELAPTNPAVLEQNGVLFAFTSNGLDDPKEYINNIRKAVAMGLSKETALKALTYNPAMILDAQEELGSLHPDKYANFIITSGDLFDKKTKIHENWVAGKRYIIEDYTKLDIAAKYSLNIDGKIYMLEVKGDYPKYKGTIEIDTTKIKVSVKQTENLIALSFELDDENYNGLVSLSGKINYKSGIWDGNGTVADSDWLPWSAIKQREKIEEKEKKEENKIDTLVGRVTYPLMAYGFDSLPKTNTYLIKGVTVWTCDTMGVLPVADVLIKDGKIAQVGQDLTMEGVEVINGKKMHLTPGIIDEHSHIAISKGVNECTQAVTSEVSIADVVNADDINIYRQLSGGVTASQLLHGSCNPVGGQSALIKLRWGESAEKMKIAGADGFIKFALGENVKRTNFGDAYNKRFPQTRMGVEQVYYDAFTRALEYETDLAKFMVTYNLTKKKERDQLVGPRRDLELDALAEIMNKKRFISCHSYQQGEINMLMHVADSFGFTVNTFTHILEGYKVADKMKEHGAGGSTFSDWWAYKYEVNDAIPYNGALMHEQGVVTAFNSDDAEMGRRLNQEAAKAVKYGGVSEEEALKFVTLNPAKLLHLDDRMGSITVGKDADLVLWTDHPLSIYAKANKTFIDGKIYYDQDRDIVLREAIRKEKARLVAKSIKAKKNGEPVQKAKPKEDILYHCDTVTNENQ